MLNGQDACDYRNFFWSAEAREALLAVTNISISDLGCGRDDFFNHREVSQRTQTVKSAPAQATTVNFRVSVATNVGERVVAVGSCTQLGMWEPRKGLELHTTVADFPLWQAHTCKNTLYSDFLM